MSAIWLLVLNTTSFTNPMPFCQGCDVYMFSMWFGAGGGSACWCRHPGAAVGEIWGMLDLMCGDWGGAARDPQLGLSGMWEWRLMGRTRSSAVHSQYCKFLPRFLWV